MDFSEKITTFIHDEFPEYEGRIDELELNDLKTLRDFVQQKREEYALIELAYKTSANAAYGSCANGGFYFFRTSLASDITSECYRLTEFMWNRIPQFLKEDIWERKDIWELCDFKLDESKHEWMRQQTISHQADTDSTYASYWPLFEAMTPEYKEKYSTDEAKVKWILNFYKKFMDAQQRKWCEEMYNPRHGKNVHEFELELICKSTIGLAKKKYVKGVAFEKGHFMIDNPKLKSTGVEIVKSTTPPLCRQFMKETVNDFLYNYNPQNRDKFILYLNEKLRDYYRRFKAAPIDDISQSVAVGDYKKYVINDKDMLLLEKRAPFSVKAAARYNYVAHKNGRDDLVLKSGKIKYYNIRINSKDTDYYGFPPGECPDFAPKIDYTIQWQKTFVDPINRFLKALNIPEVMEGTNCIMNTLF